MQGWITYLKERFPLPVYLLLAGGLALSATAISGRNLLVPSMYYSFAYAMWLFATLRLMDELKDFEKDVIAHPTRPLPRGILNRETVRKVIGYSMIVGVGLSFGFYQFSSISCLLAMVTTVWLWLMYKEFYVGQALSKRPLLYAITHQIILVPFCLCMVIYPSGELLGFLNSFPFWWSIGVLGSFFTFEVSRKLDPDAHPILGTYLTTYGRVGSLIIVLALLGLCIYAGREVMLWKLMTPWAVLTVASYALLWLAPRKFKVIEGAATISLFFHIWAPTIFYFLVKPGV